MNTHINNREHGLHHTIFHHRSAFAKAACCAIVIGVGDLLATGADILWLAGDMMHSPQWYHKYIAIGLSLAFIVMVISFIYLYHSLIIFVNKQAKKEELEAARIRQETRDTIREMLDNEYNSL